MNTISELSFSDFEKTSKYMWSQKLKEELRQVGKELLKQETSVEPEPFYTLEDMDIKTVFAHTQFLRSPLHSWLLDEPLFFNDGAIAKAEKAIVAGADGISLVISQALSSEKINAISKINSSSKFINFCFDADIEIPQLLFEGNHFGVLRINNKKAWPSDGTLEQLCGLLKTNDSKYRFVSIPSSWHTNGDMATELSMTLALGIEYINYFTDRGISIPDALKTIEFSFTIGKNFLREITKLRAFRLLWNRVIEAYAVNPAEVNTPIHCTTSLELASSPENAIRLSVEAIAAVLGGCNSLTITPFSNDKTDFPERISRNIALLLKEESFLDKVIDPLGGSYYIEKTTSILAEKTWSMLRYIENKGGYLKNV